MRYLGTGVKYGSWGRLLGDLDGQAFADRTIDTLRSQAPALKKLRAIQDEPAFRSEKRRRVIDRGDPRSAGWTLLLRADDPDREAIVRAMRPLAEHRGMLDPGRPMVFDGAPPHRWNEWFMANHSRISPHKDPEYILIVGGPDKVPFQFQTFLDIATSVGRLDLERVEDIEAYVAKVLRLERAPGPAPACRAMVFAPDGGPGDPTHYSRHHMAEPMARHIRNADVPVIALLGEQATKELLLTSTSHRPALVYLASHGVLAPGEGLSLQKRVNGAIHCAGPEGSMFGAADVPVAGGEPFFEGSVFFAFACFSAGTPAESDFARWAGGQSRYATEDFTAALPRRLLAHPRGPIAFIGHVDAAFLLGFSGPAAQPVQHGWDQRMGPFVAAVSSLLDVQPAGLALTEMNARHASTSVHLLRLLERLERGTIARTPEVDEDLAHHFVLRSDARNYIVLGDPAARLRMPGPPSADR